MSDDTRSAQDRAAEVIALFSRSAAPGLAQELADAGLLADGSDARKLADELRKRLRGLSAYTIHRDSLFGWLDELCPPAPEPTKRERFEAMYTEHLHMPPGSALLSVAEAAGLFDDEGEA